MSVTAADDTAVATAVAPVVAPVVGGGDAGIWPGANAAALHKQQQQIYLYLTKHASVHIYLSASVAPLVDFSFF